MLDTATVRTYTPFAALGRTRTIWSMNAEKFCSSASSVNETLLKRCGLSRRDKILGLTAEEVYPKPLGAGYTAQDQLVLEKGIEIRDKLELHLYPGGGQGWCLTFKTPIRDGGGAISGLVGISRDLYRPDEHDADYRRLARAVDELQQRYAETVRL